MILFLATSTKSMVIVTIGYCHTVHVKTHNFLFLEKKNIWKFKRNDDLEANNMKLFKKIYNWWWYGQQIVELSIAVPKIILRDYTEKGGFILNSNQHNI